MRDLWCKYIENSWITINISHHTYKRRRLTWETRELSKTQIHLFFFSFFLAFRLGFRLEFNYLLLPRAIHIWIWWNCIKLSQGMFCLQLLFNFNGWIVWDLCFNYEPWVDNWWFLGCDDWLLLVLIPYDYLCYGLLYFEFNHMNWMVKHSLANGHG